MAVSADALHAENECEGVSERYNVTDLTMWCVCVCVCEVPTLQSWPSSLWSQGNDVVPVVGEAEQ